MITFRPINTAIKTGIFIGLVLGWLFSGPGYFSLLRPAWPETLFYPFVMGLACSFGILFFKMAVSFFSRLPRYLISGMVILILFLQLFISSPVFLGITSFMLGLATAYILIYIAKIFFSVSEIVYLVGTMLLVGNIIYKGTKIYLYFFPDHLRLLSLLLSFSTILFFLATDHKYQQSPSPVTTQKLNLSLSLKGTKKKNSLDIMLLLSFFLLTILIYWGGIVAFAQLLATLEPNQFVPAVYPSYLLSFIFFSFLIKRFKPSYVLGYAFSIFGCAVATSLAVEGSAVLSIIALVFFSISGAGIDIFLILLLVTLSKYFKSANVLSGLLIGWLLIELSNRAGIFYGSNLLLENKLLYAVITGLILICLPLLHNYNRVFMWADNQQRNSDPQVQNLQAATAQKTHLMLELTPTEIRVYELICIGQSNADIAASLEISINTVKYHIRNIIRKAGVNNKYELLALVRNNR